MPIGKLSGLFLASSLLVLLPGHALAGVKTDWMVESRVGNILELYRINNYIDGILYVETKFYMNVKSKSSKPRLTKWSVDCRRHRMRNSYGTIWVKENGIWVEERRGYLAGDSVAEAFALYCSHLD